MRNTQARTAGFTGWHMLGVMALFFGTIISVNLVMAWNAVSSWSGLVVKNTYVASQEFNGKVADARRLAATGIAGTLEATREGLDYRLAGPDGKPVAADRVTATLKRPVDERDDVVLVLLPAGEGLFRVEQTIASGQWVVDLVALRNGESVFRETLRIVIPGSRP